MQCGETQMEVSGGRPTRTMECWVFDCAVAGGLALAFYSYLGTQCNASSTYAQGAIWTMARESALDSLAK